MVDALVVVGEIVVVGATVVTAARGFTVVVVDASVVVVAGVDVVVVSSVAFRVRIASSNFRSSTGGRDALTVVDCKATGIETVTELAPSEPLSTTEDFLPVTLTDSREISLSPVCFAISYSIPFASPAAPLVFTSTVGVASLTFNEIC